MATSARDALASTHRAAPRWYDEPPGIDRLAGAQPGAITSEAIVEEYHGRVDSCARLRTRCCSSPTAVAMTPSSCATSSPAAYADVRVARDASRAGWGRAVAAGLAAARGDLLCYTNSARTAAAGSARCYCSTRLHIPDVVIKANRKSRENWRRRAGSMLFNLECRVLFDLSSSDINGTPKVFPRRFDKLLDPDARRATSSTPNSAACAGARTTLCSRCRFFRAGATAGAPRPITASALEACTGARTGCGDRTAYDAVAVG